MADEETIVIRVNAAQGEAALKALGKAGIEAGKGVESITPAAGGASLQIKDLTKNIGAGISLLSILRENLDALKPALDGLGNSIKFAATQAGADTETVTNLGRALDSLIHPSHIAANAVDSLKEAWHKFEESVVGSSTVVPHAVKTIEESLSLLAAARKQAAADAEESADQEKKAAEDSAKEWEKLEEAAVKSAQERAKAEQAASEAIIAAIAAENQALDEKLAKDEARLEAALAKGQKIDTSGDSDEAKKNIAELRDEIKQLEQQPTLDAEQINRLNDLKDKAGAAATEMRNLSKVFTQTADDFLTEGEAADAAGAAWDVYGDLLGKAANRHKEATRDFDQAEESIADLSDTTEEAAEGMGELADSAKDLGEEGKRGGDKAKEGLEGLIEQQDTAKANYAELIALATTLKQINAEISLE